MDGDEGEYANKYLPFQVDFKELTGKRILAVPGCCQIRKGTTDRLRINDGVKRREETAEEQTALTISDAKGLSTRQTESRGADAGVLMWFTPLHNEQCKVICFISLQWLKCQL